MRRMTLEDNLAMRNALMQIHKEGIWNEFDVDSVVALWRISKKTGKMRPSPEMMQMFGLEDDDM